MTLGMIMALTLWAATAEVESWQCQNDLEIQCTTEGCEVAAEGEFTPLRVHVDDSGSMSICAYSGCWEGTGKVVQGEEFLMLLGENLKFSTSPDSTEAQESIALVIDRTDSIGILKAGTFSQPVRCQRIVQE